MVQWPAEGVPDNPRGWLVTIASRTLVDRPAATAPAGPRSGSSRRRPGPRSRTSTTRWRCCSCAVTRR
ncbi:hypothetical protein [Streptosporangium longisporum]|uniref:hypothetical protein n=1 Tax=Streptosporangium longisporum TaxID=46187 RepID=UPI003CD06DB0